MSTIFQRICNFSRNLFFNLCKYVYLICILIKLENSIHEDEFEYLE